MEAEEEWVLFQSVFVDLVDSGIPRIRELAAFNFPAVLSAMVPCPRSSEPRERGYKRRVKSD